MTGTYVEPKPKADFGDCGIPEHDWDEQQQAGRDKETLDEMVEEFKRLSKFKI